MRNMTMKKNETAKAILPGLGTMKVEMMVSRMARQTASSSTSKILGRRADVVEEDNDMVVAKKTCQEEGSGLEDDNNEMI